MATRSAQTPLGGTVGCKAGRQTQGVGDATVVVPTGGNGSTAGASTDAGAAAKAKRRNHGRMVAGQREAPRDKVAASSKSHSDKKMQAQAGTASTRGAHAKIKEDDDTSKRGNEAMASKSKRPRRGRKGGPNKTKKEPRVDELATSLSQRFRQRRRAQAASGQGTSRNHNARSESGRSNTPRTTSDR